LSGAIFFGIIYAILSRWFYSQKDTITPLLVSILAIALNIYLSVTLSRPGAYGIAGLAMAQSIVAAVEVTILWAVMLYRDPKLFNRKFWGGIFRIMSVTGFSVLASFVMISLLPLDLADRGFVTLGVKVGSIVAVTFLVHFWVSWLFGLEEVKPVLQKARQLMQATIRI
jgi:putative peptidoglycan lipid II flippase